MHPKNIMSEVLASRRFHTLLNNRVQSTMNNSGSISLESVNLAIATVLTDYERGRRATAVSSFTSANRESLKNVENELFPPMGVVANMTSRLKFFEDQHNSTQSNREARISMIWSLETPSSPLVTIISLYSVST